MSRFGEVIRHDEERCADPKGCACMCEDCDSCPPEGGFDPDNLEQVAEWY